MTAAPTDTGHRIHRAVPRHGPEIAGRVHGHGPPLVLVHGAMDDGEQDWGALLPHLADRFTCYVMSTRGRGLSADHPAHAPDDLVQDVTAFAESIGEPVSLAGTSGGARLVLGAAARSAVVSAVAAYEPVVLEAMSPDDRRHFRDVLARIGRAAERDRPAEAARVFLEFAANDAEFAAVCAEGELEAAARYLPVDLEEFRLAVGSHGPSPTEPSTLGRISAPTLLLHGSRTARSWFTASVRFAAQHIPGARVRELRGAGHLAPLIEPELVAAALVGFLDREAQAT